MGHRHTRQLIIDMVVGLSTDVAERRHARDRRPWCLTQLGRRYDALRWLGQLLQRLGHIVHQLVRRGGVDGLLDRDGLLKEPAGVGDRQSSNGSNASVAAVAVA
ncbi:hypothetical protein [Mycobacterium tuberculosis]|uniref:hypothetical protein n=1 Tax=Mycobacterium tuberculosis TaxID=1773 RepID=UPI003D7C3414